MDLVWILVYNQAQGPPAQSKGTKFSLKIQEMEESIAFEQKGLN